MSQIRNFGPEDIPAVAKLFQKTFRDSRKPAARSLESYLLDLFLKDPHYDPELASRVYISSSGTLKGFIGVLPKRMSFRGQLIRAAQPTTFMVDSPEENPWAGAALLKSVLAGPQDLSFGDDTNEITRNLWEKLGGQALPLESMHWVRLLRPTVFALSILGDEIRSLKVLQPACSVIDRVAARMTADSIWLKKPISCNTDADVDDATLYQLLSEFTAPYALRPVWDADRLKWLLSHASQKQRYGKLFRRVVFDVHSKPLGCYLYFGRSGSVARVLQLLARPEAAGSVADSLLAHAYQGGCVAVRGAVQSRLIYALRQRGCVFFGLGSVLVHSGNKELIQAARLGDSLLNGLAGEEWSRLVGDEFS
jgi:hypothetical protein